MTDPVSYPAVRDYLYSLKNRGSKYGIERMREFVNALNHPEQTFPCIHVAGTNGKGSVCAMLEAIYRTSQYKTGLYTSPHLIRQGERVQINREILLEEEICRLTTRLKPIAKKVAGNDFDNHPSFFEFMTAMAFLRFAEENVDIALIETGLGGRLDATNVIEPELSIITSISLDHVEQLGNTLEKIAFEKAGIIKPGKPVVIGKLPSEAEEVIRRITIERDCPLFSVTERYRSENEIPSTNLIGVFQKWNAATSLLAAEVLQEKFPTSLESNKNALTKVHWRGRWEILRLQGKTLILDATHNPEGVAELSQNLENLIHQNGKKPIIIASALGEMRASSLIPLVSKYASDLYLVAPSQDRASRPEELLRHVPRTAKITTHQTTLETLFPKKEVCTLGEGGETIVLTGSLYLIGEALERLTCESPANQANLQDNP